MEENEWEEQEEAEPRCGRLLTQNKELLERHAVLQSPSRIEELVEIFIHATKVGFFLSCFILFSSLPFWFSFFFQRLECVVRCGWVANMFVQMEIAFWEMYKSS